MFRLERAVAVLHPDRPVVAFHLLWRDDAHGAWLPFTRPTDQEVLWVGVDSSGAPTDLWTYWHGVILHADWRGKGQVVVDVQWGKHGTLPRGTAEADLPALQGLTGFWLLSWILTPDLLLGRLAREGPLCFCGSPGRYREFTEPVFLAPRLNAVVQTEDPTPVLEAVFGDDYSRKPNWPWEAGS